MLQREFVARELEREWAMIESEEKKLEEEKRKVVAEWVSVEDAQKEYNKKREACVIASSGVSLLRGGAVDLTCEFVACGGDRFEKVARARFSFLPHDEVVAFNVGGQLFKSTVKVWTRDRFSILAQLCTTKPKLPKVCAADDAYFFDRDFWIFQFIYAFLRDNSLPSAVDVLRELYCEASFYRVGLLRHAIESKMLGEDAMAASLLASAAQSSSASSASPAAAPPPQSAPSLLPSTRPGAASLSAILAKSSSKQQESGATGAAASTALATASPSPAHKYSELPDPFGFTSKKP